MYPVCTHEDANDQLQPNESGLRLQAVLFDMDGTLVDTEPYWMAAEYKIVGEYGGSWSDEHAHALVGNALLTSAEYLRTVGGVPLDAPVIVERMLDDVVAAAGQAMRWQPGALDLVAECRSAGIPCAMVTMSYLRLAQVLVELLPTGTFATVVTGDDVQHGKPHPEAYLTACARLGVRPTRTVAIEDSPTGIASAEAAGCVVVGVPHRVPIEPGRGRTLVGSLRELSVASLDALLAPHSGRDGDPVDHLGG